MSVPTLGDAHTLTNRFRLEIDAEVSLAERDLLIQQHIHEQLQQAAGELLYGAGMLGWGHDDAYGNAQRWLAEAVCSDTDTMTDATGRRVLRPTSARLLPTIEHKVPRALGGSNALDNLGLACWPCNSRKGAQ